MQHIATCGAAFAQHDCAFTQSVLRLPYTLPPSPQHTRLLILRIPHFPRLKATPKLKRGHQQIRSRRTPKLCIFKKHGYDSRQLGSFTYNLYTKPDVRPTGRYVDITYSQSFQESYKGTYLTSLASSDLETCWAVLEPTTSLALVPLN